MLSRGTVLVQNAWVVPSLEEAVQQWLRAGVGPFHTLERSYDALYRGTPTTLGFRVALAQAGPIQIELIEQTSEGPSAYRDVVPVGTTGFHHMCALTDDLDAEVASLQAAGVEIAAEIFRAGGERAVYADTRAQLGCMVEIIPRSPGLQALFDLVAGSAVGWDGSDPVRPVTADALAGAAGSVR